MPQHINSSQKITETYVIWTEKPVGQTDIQIGRWIDRQPDGQRDRKSQCYMALINILLLYKNSERLKDNNITV